MRPSPKIPHTVIIIYIELEPNWNLLLYCLVIMLLQGTVQVIREEKVSLVLLSCGTSNLLSCQARCALWSNNGMTVVG